MSSKLSIRTVHNAKCQSSNGAASCWKIVLPGHYCTGMHLTRSCPSFPWVSTAPVSAHATNLLSEVELFRQLA